MPLLTPRDLVTMSLKAIGVLGVGQTASPEDASDAFSAMNAMLGVWARKRWLVLHLIDVPFQATGQLSYTIGPTGDINVPRPDRIEAAFFRQFVQDQPNEVDYPLQIIDSREDYNQIALKTLSTWPLAVFYDSAYPLGNVFIWPVPQAGLYEIHLSIKDTLAQFQSYYTQVNLPPEYIEAIWTNLTIRLAAIYPGTQPSPAVEALAKSSLATIRGANAQIPTLDLPPGVGGPPAKYNIFSDRQYV